MAAQLGRRLRRGAVTSAVAAVAMAALTASQAPDLLDMQRGRTADAPGGTPIDGGSPYLTELPPLKTPDKPGTSIDLPGAATGAAEAGIPASVLAAYKKAESALADTSPRCNLPWQLLAAIGKVESGQARGGAVDAEGTTVRPILGPQLNGNGFARITDTDNGAYDGDTTHDRAVGPMQFIPSTWASWGADGNGDGEKNPNNVYDAALAAGRYLCADGRDLSVEADLHRAILGYNHSRAYLRTVLSWLEFYKKGTHEVPDGGVGVLHSANGPGSRGGEGGKTGGTNESEPSNGGRSHPSEPAPGGSGTPAPGGSGTPAPGGSGTPAPGGSGTPAPGGSGTPTPAESLKSLERVSTQTVAATTGGEFGDPLRIRAESSAGKPLAGVRVEFTIIGETDARFPGSATSAEVTTGSGDGIATAPELLAGKQSGTFTVRATAVGGSVPGVEFAARVEPRLACTSDETPTAKTGSSFADGVEVRVTHQGKPAAGVAVSAMMVTDDPDHPVENDEGPYFAKEQDQPVRTMEGLKTDAGGLLKLPTIFTDEHPGTFLLRLATADGATLTLELTVT